MDNAINLPAVYIANAMGVIIAFIMLAGNKWKLSGSDSESRSIRQLLLVVISACLVDPIEFTVDGRPGKLNFLIGYAGNLWLYMANLIICPLWVKVIVKHMKGRLTRWLRLVLYALIFTGVLMLVINFFVPIVFSIDSSNVYSRGPAFWVYMAMDVIVILTAIFIYFLSCIKGDRPRFFPVWQFALPLIAGAAMQSLIYGISAIWPFIAVSISGIMNSLHNETIYQDRLTGLYNRFFLDNIKKEIMYKQNSDITAMMLDMNDFKSINDNFGHAAGDEALKTVSAVIRESVGSDGYAIRYAGDEFVILLKTQKKETVENCIDSIRSELERINKSENKDYDLSVSIGHCPLDLNNQTIDELMNEVDKLMYEDKKRFYEANPECNRRHRI